MPTRCAVAVTLVLATLLTPGRPAAQPALPARVAPYAEASARLIAAAQADDFAWQRLAELTDTFGNRLTGSANLTRAIGWAVATLKRDGLANVHTEKVVAPKWVRGAESAVIVDPPEHPIAMLGLGGSVGTPPGGIEAEVLVVKSYQDLDGHSAQARGKIVLFNVPYVGYGETVQYRTGGAAAAARHGAVAALVRAVGPMGLRTPHTGNMNYGDAAVKIPAAAIAAEDANRIQRLADRGVRVRIRLQMSARFEPDVESANVFAEVVGRERPDEIVLVGCHFDSWDVGAGASDDGVGCIVTWEALRLMKSLGLQPRRTVRLGLFTNEENGLRGGNAYRDAHQAAAANHVFALESDSGVFAPARLGFTGSTAARAVIDDIGALLRPLGLSDIGPGGGGADIGPIAQAGNVPMMAYQGDAARYFTIHHTPADTVDRIAPEEVSTAAAAIAVVAYVVAELPEALPK